MAKRFVIELRSNNRKEGSAEGLDILELLNHIQKYCVPLDEDKKMDILIREDKSWEKNQHA